MRIGLVGLGRIGSDMVRRLMGGGHNCVVTDLDRDAVTRLADEGTGPAASLDQLVTALEVPRVVWVMALAGPPTENVVTAPGRPARRWRRRDRRPPRASCVVQVTSMWLTSPSGAATLDHQHAHARR